MGRGRNGALLGGSAAVVLTAAMLTTSTASDAVVRAAGTVNGFGYGKLQTQTIGTAGCGSNTAGEPSIHVSRANLVGLGSEDGVGSGSEYWRTTQVGGSTAA